MINFNFYRSIFDRSNITHLLLAVIIAANPLTWVLAIPYSLAIIVVSSTFLIFIFNFMTLLKRINFRSVLFIFYLFFFFLISLLLYSFQKQTQEYFYQFLVLGFLPIIVSHVDVNVKKLLSFVVLIGIMYAPYAYIFDIEKLDYSEYENFSGFIMAISYGLLRFLVASIVLLFFFKNKFHFKIMLIVEIFAISTFLLLFGTRGALVSIILLFMTIYVLRKAKTASTRKIILTLVSGVVLTISMLMIFVFIVYPMLQDHKISFIFIDKTLDLSKEGSISNERDNLFVTAMNGFLESPLIGNGIGSFDNFSGFYTHNVFTHFLYEGGILLGIPFFYLIFKSIFIIFSGRYDYDYRLLVLFLLFSSVVELLFSSQPWISQIFWLYIGFLLVSYKYRIQTESNEDIINS